MARKKFVLIKFVLGGELNQLDVWRARTEMVDDADNYKSKSRTWNQ